MAHIAIQKTGTLPGFPWEWRVSTNDHDLWAEGTERAFETALDEVETAFRDMIEEADETITRDNQQTDTIYVGYSRFPWSSKDHLVVFVTPDGEGRYYFDSVAEAQRDMLDGDTFPIRYVARIED